MGYSVWELVNIFIETGELADALAILDQHLLENPHDAKALGMRGEIHLRLNQLEHAITDFRAIYHPTPDQSIHHAVALKRLGIFGLGLDVLTDAFSEWDGDKTVDYYRLVDCFVDLAIAKGDVADLQRALDHLGKVDGLHIAVRKGEVTQLLGDFYPAIAYYSEAIEQIHPQIVPNHYLVPQFISWLCARAGCYQAIGDDELAIADYTLAESLMPDDLAIAMKRAILLDDKLLIRAIWARADEKQRLLLAGLMPDGLDESETNS